MRIASPILATVVVALLSGCMSREAPTTRTQKIEQGVTITLTKGVVSEESGIVDISSPDANLGYEKKTKVIGAERASIISTGTSTPGGTTTYNDDFIIRYSEYIEQSDSIEIPITIKNISKRAFGLSGIVIRAETSNKSVSASIPSDVTNGKRLAPGEKMTAILTLNNASSLQTADAVLVRMFEVPGEINPAGEITKKVNAEIRITATRVDTQVSLETYYRKEPRRYTGSAPSDLHKFLK